jgi:hypothetical protein
MASATTTLVDLVRDLKLYGGVQPSENFADPNDFNRIVVRAATRHNKAYTCAVDSCTIPTTEHFAVVLLAWSDLSIIRASRFATQASTTQSGTMFGTDRNTPFYKCMELSKKLGEQYEEECKSLGLEIYAGYGSVSLSTVTCENVDLEAQTPIEFALNPPAISLTAADVQGDGTAILRWTQDFHTNFATYKLFYHTSEIYQDWNITSARCPRINADAQFVGALNDQASKAIKLTDLSTVSGTTHHFLIVCVSRSETYAYSNEVVNTQA